MGSAAVWTLWLATNLGQGAAVVTPLATYATEGACYLALERTDRGEQREYHNAVPFPGVMFCVEGVPPRS